jgi:triacylglycerol lipase
MARKIRYVAQRQALYHPELDPTVLTPGARPPLDALCAEMSRLAYRRFEQAGPDRAYVERTVAHAGYGDTVFFCVGGSQAFATCNTATRTVIVAFRGTQSDDIRDLITDARFRPTPWQPGGMAHSGFAEAAVRLFAAGLDAWLRQHGDWARVYTGHSLGAALATLAASAAPPCELVTFGSPLVGDAAFGRTLDGGPIRRYVDCCDLVTRIPPPSIFYQHAGAMRYIDRDGIVGSMTSTDDIHHDRDLARLEYFHDYALVPGDVTLRDLADHAPANYVYAMFGTPITQ